MDAICFTYIASFHDNFLTVFLSFCFLSYFPYCTQLRFVACILKIYLQNILFDSLQKVWINESFDTF